MKISTKTKYGLISLIYLGEFYDEKAHISLIKISNHYNISKQYLEQAFVLLKKSGLVISTKGPKGGYILSREPGDISIYEILLILEPDLFDKNVDELPEFPEIDTTLNKLIYENIDNSITFSMQSITLLELIKNKEKYKDQNFIMNYI